MCLIQRLSLRLFILACVQLSAREFLVVDMAFSPKSGMFAVANQLLGALCLYEEGEFPEATGLSVDFKEFGLYYDADRGPNWWSYYFEPISIGSSESPQVRCLAKREYLKAFSRRREITRAQAAALIKKYVHVKPPILEKVDQFTQRHFQNPFVLGVHYRGTDKKSEAPQISYETVFEKIDEHIPEDQLYQIFVATDEAPFLERIREKYPGRIIAAVAHRAEGEEAVHFLEHHHYELGEEALIDALLLSRCSLLIRTSSSLSLWSTYFNPELPVVLLNRRFLRTLEPE